MCETTSGNDYIQTKDSYFIDDKDYWVAVKVEDEVPDSNRKYDRRKTQLSATALNEKTITIGQLILPAGSYILTLKQYCDKLEYCYLECNGSALLPMNAKEGDYSIEKQQVYFFTFLSDDDAEEEIYTIRYKWASNTSTTDKSKIDLEPVIKMNNNEGYYLNEAVNAKILELDYKKVFNYAYQVPEDILIKDPLESQTFFDENHIYNQFILPQINSIVIRDVR